MAYYVNGTLISGANTLPKMAMAEYLALPVSERPTYWECTDKDYVDISAEDVTYGNGSVKDALDGLTSNNIGSGVALTAGTAYTTPSNGYIQIYVRANSEIDLSVLSSGNNNGVRFDVINTASSGIYQFTYVTKGLRILWSASTAANNGWVSFHPLV